MEQYKTLDTFDGISFDIGCPICFNSRSILTKERPKNIMKMPIETYEDDYGEHHHDSGMYEGKWYCSEGHSGTYYRHKLCSVRSCKFSKF